MVDRRRSSLRTRAGATARRVLTGVLLAFSIALLVRPSAFLLAAINDEDHDGLPAALAACGLHLVVIALAASLFLRSRRNPPATG